ncbi:lysophospholipid acyltransferase family protein [Rhodococcus rhodnii]|uniref:lysophospholipid acyltransferase family protein n=1 Tax=Rhodococcus rhodnii TaxID=38312 RepID=UPI0009F8382B|nr:lysophospholipid acyltransferase family protein [Rhodococcus rhodnii]
MTEHAWAPASPCGLGCIPRERPATGVRAVRRTAAGAALLAAGPFALRRGGGPAGETQRRAARALLRALGVRLALSGEPAAVTGGALVVAHHTSWLDVVALAAVVPADFVARADLVSWPVLGALARAVDVVPVDRARLRSLPHAVDRVRDRLAQGRTVVVFPEGTTWCGRAHGRLRPAFFQAAVEADVPVVPLRLHYRRDDGPTTLAAFVGEDSIGSSVLRIAGARELTAVVETRPALYPARTGAGGRRDLAAAAERALLDARSPADVGGLAGPARTSEEVTAV